MEEWISQVLESSSLSLAVFPAAFLLGVLGSVTSCCNVPVLAAITGYSGALGGKTDRRVLYLTGLFFMIGTIIALGALGAVTGFVGQVAGASLGQYWKLVVGLILVFFGLATLNLAPFSLPKLGFSRAGLPKGFIGAMVYGLAVGGATTACSACCNPALPVALGVATLQGHTLWGAAMLSAFAVGYSLPMAGILVGLGLGLGKLTLVVQKIAPVLTTAAGGLLIGVGFYLLAAP